MRILLSNDDGIHAAGIRALMEALCEEHDVYVAAPASERSAHSHSVTYFMKQNRAERLDIAGVKEAWAIDGTPADCVWYALNGLLDVKPDLVISGINHGENLSDDCIYSGTVGAALEAVIGGYPAMAVSLCSRSPQSFADSAWIAKTMIPYYLNDPECRNYVLNINVPDLPMDLIKGFRTTGYDGRRNYEKDIEKLPQKDGSYLLKCINVPVVTHPNKGDLPGDVTAVKEGYVSLSPLYGDMVSRRHLSGITYPEDLFMHAE